ncbi:hypothetical protein B0A55_09620 [Friedmanniomyces simplex]|uniref:Rhodopsin domain-containing protein n=1 Tax=Friedmanniomyces simplex TaxID=329884 RepID=A0A4U0WK73_9PEZI|nr:hypothetical protein B0A55_09620 [Friedmanniomyces simplex]
MATSLPSGYSPAAHPLSPDDHGGWAVVASSIGLLFILTFACIRLWVRNPLRAKLYPNDIALLAATALATIQTILVIAAADHGLGKTSKLLGDSSQDTVDKIVYASDAIFLVALFLSKISVLLLELRMSPEKWHVMLTKGGLAACGAALLTHECQALYTRWIAVFCLDVAFELYIYAVILRMLIALQRNASKKMKATVMFSLRLPVIIFAAFRLHELSNFRTSTSPLFDGVLIVVWTQTELAYSLAAATIPILMPFLIGLNTGLGAFDRDNMIIQTQQDSSLNQRSGYGMHSMKRSHVSRVSQVETQIRGDNVMYKSSVVSPQADQRSVGSDDSTRVIIRKTVDVSFSPSAPYETTDM